MIINLMAYQLGVSIAAKINPIPTVAYPKEMQNLFLADQKALQDGIRAANAMQTNPVALRRALTKVNKILALGADNGEQ